MFRDGQRLFHTLLYNFQNGQSYREIRPFLFPRGQYRPPLCAGSIGTQPGAVKRYTRAKPTLRRLGRTARAALYALRIRFLEPSHWPARPVARRNRAQGWQKERMIEPIVKALL